MAGRQSVNYHELILRRDGDRRSDAIVKREMLAGLDRSKILFVVEDRSRVVAMWCSEGLVCLQCAPGAFYRLSHACSACISKVFEQLCRLESNAEVYLIMRHCVTETTTDNRYRMFDCVICQN